jgi:hypothetical protein
MNTTTKQRTRLVLMVLGAFACLLALLAVQQNLEYRDKTPDALAYLLKDDTAMLHDPLSIASQNLELLGVSDDEAIIGYAARSDVSQTMIEIDRAMSAQGWLVLEMSSQGISSYVRQDSCVLFVCTAQNDGTSVVAELL